jgi:hypothetical protein
MRKWIVLGLGGLLLTGCEEVTRTELRGSVAVSFATQAPAGTPAPPMFRTAALVDTQVTGTDTLIITSAQMVLREIELKAAETASCDVEPEPAGCEEVEVGPELVDLPLTPGATQQFNVDIPPGMYSRIDFEVHKVASGDPLDNAFIALHPEFDGLSIRVLGTFNSQAFVYETDLNDQQRLNLIPALAVTEGSDVNVTIKVDVDTWFRAAGGDLLHPASANKGGPNENEVKDNIIASLRAFEDDDRDGDDSG